MAHVFLSSDSIQRAAGSGGGDGAGHRHVLPLPAGEGHEEFPTTAGGVCSLFFLSLLFTLSVPPTQQFTSSLTLPSHHCLSPPVVYNPINPALKDAKNMFVSVDKQDGICQTRWYLFLKVVVCY